jgi:hypothetical protein
MTVAEALSMQIVVHVQGWGTMVALLIVVFAVKGYGAGSRRALIGSVGIVLLSAFQLIFLANVESVLGPLFNQGLVSQEDSASAKAAINLWNILVPLIAGGVGINLFTSWLTFVPDAKASERR